MVFCVVYHINSYAVVNEMCHWLGIFVILSDHCGRLVAIALADMHECGPNKKEVKRFRGICSSKDINGVREQSIGDQPRSAFCFFMWGFRFEMFVPFALLFLKFLLLSNESRFDFIKKKVIFLVKQMFSVIINYRNSIISKLWGSCSHPRSYQLFYLMALQGNP